MSAKVPSPSALAHLRPADGRGLLVTASAMSLTAVGVAVSVQGTWTVWLAGQLLLACAFVQWFVLLHECGHDTLFESRRLNAAIGACAGIMSMIPFRCWRRIHARHHKWTGWQDLDPTTEALAPRFRSRTERLLLNTCWRLWIPIFAIAYRAQNFWNLRRVFLLFPRETDRRAIARDTAVMLVIYVALAVMVGPTTLVRVALCALLLSLAVEDLMLLSQHTHLPQGVSGGESVRPYPAIEQAPFTRSLRLPSWASALVLHFDAHELHHMYPFVPGYHLREIPYSPENEIGWWQWVTRAKRTPADVLLFENRLHTGLDV